jgi:hypothetical protein
MEQRPTVRTRVAEWNDLQRRVLQHHSLLSVFEAVVSCRCLLLLSGEWSSIVVVVGPWHFDSSLRSLVVRGPRDFTQGTTEISQSTQCSCGLVVCSIFVVPATFEDRNLFFLFLYLAVRLHPLGVYSTLRIPGKG